MEKYKNFTAFCLKKITLSGAMAIILQLISSAVCYLRKPFDVYWLQKVKKHSKYRQCLKRNKKYKCLSHSSRLSIFLNQGPVVQSIVSLTSLFMTNLLTVVTKGFCCCKNVSSFCNANTTHIFSAKNINVFAKLQDRNFNVTLANNFVQF